MAASSCCRSWLLVLPLVGLGLSTTARAETLPQAELTCLLGSGELLESAGAPPAEAPPWQGLASLRRGDENRVRLAFGRDDVGFWQGVTTSAVLRLELGLGGRAAQPAVRDVSSWFGIAWELGSRASLSVRAFPFDTDYQRLGYLHALDWGGTDSEQGESIFLSQEGGVPGLEIRLAVSPIRLFSGLKWAQVDDALRGGRRLWGVLAGGSFDVAPTVRLDGGFGYFQRPALALEDAGAPSFVEGASLRAVWHQGPFEPELSPEPFRPAPFDADLGRFEADAPLGLALALEGSLLVQRLRRFEAPSTTALTPAPAAALYGSVRTRRLAAHLAVTWQSLAFVLRNDARLARGQTLPMSALERAESSAWLGGSVTLQRLVPSLELGLRLPAALETPSTLPGFGQTLLAGGASGLVALPLGAERLPVLAARLGARLQVSAAVALSLFAEYQRNPNRVASLASASGVTRGFAPPDSLAAFSSAQARF